MIQILYCLRNPSQSLQLQELCRRSGLQVRAFRSGDAGKPVVSLLQPGMVPGKVTGTSAPLLWQAPEFILMSGIRGPQMEAFLDACKNIGISQNVLKAVVTPVNASWTMYALLSQLQSEHSLLQNR